MRRLRLSRRHGRMVPRRPETGHDNGNAPLPLQNTPMSKKILLPNNAFGCLILLGLMALAFIVPFCVTLWLASLLAPWWVSVPLAIAVGTVVFLKNVSFK